ncbi:23S rRNA (guanosine(2251)-2'-O)-methyltransferase RlmB [bacterium]|nr:23S rRNA (guanosine(2251)-2'-O)-methyltransferase RlmB [bacterium]
MASSSIVIGFHAVEELLKSNTTVSKVLVNNAGDKVKTGVLRALCKERNVPLQMVPMVKLNSVSRKNHQGVIAFSSAIDFVPLEETITRLYEEGVEPKVVIADGIHDVRNLGAIARSCFAFGVHVMVIGTKSNAEISEAAIKSSAGALLKLPVARVRSMNDTVAYLKSWGLVQLGATEKGGIKLNEYKTKPGGWCLWLGNEDKGLSRERLAEIDEHLAIPMSAEIDSLNVSVAAGIMLYSLSTR